MNERGGRECSVCSQQRTGFYKTGSAVARALCGMCKMMCKSWWEESIKIKKLKI